MPGLAEGSSPVKGRHSIITQGTDQHTANTCPKEELTAIGTLSLLEEETSCCPFCRLSGHPFRPCSFLVIYSRDLAMWEAGGVHSLQARQMLHGVQSTVAAENYFVNSQPKPTVCSRQISPKFKGLYLKYQPLKFTSRQVLQSRGKATVSRVCAGNTTKKWSQLDF